jgi:hypothetical protein
MTPDSTPSGPRAGDLEVELHTDVEGLQVQVRALGAAVDHLCRALAASPAAEQEEVAAALEDARLALGEVW